ncbi:hypothetical protein [Streptomyces atratus]|uniref:hypothetical protein n=1 Tax=Streptomyces atratus TaxID=1893 RepID=UPI00167109EF|nr:hypothetical protein [Streptomyces atratus]
MAAAVAVELEKLRGAMETGFTKVDGSLTLLVQRGDQTDRRIDDHEQRLDTLERTRWPLPSIAAPADVTGLALTLWQIPQK